MSSVQVRPGTREARRHGMKSLARWVAVVLLVFAGASFGLTTRYIGPGRSSPDFTDFVSACNWLNTNTITDDYLFLVDAGTYNEGQRNLTRDQGIYKITFRPAVAGTEVRLTSDASPAYMVNITGTNNVKFENLTIDGGTISAVYVSTSKCRFSGCTVTGASSAAAYYVVQFTGLTAQDDSIVDCSVKLRSSAGGSYAVFFSAGQKCVAKNCLLTSTTNPSSGVSAGVCLSNVSACWVLGCTIGDATDAKFSAGIYQLAGTGANNVVANKVLNNGSSSSGIRMAAGSGHLIANNFVKGWTQSTTGGGAIHLTASTNNFCYYNTLVGSASANRTCVFLATSASGNTFRNNIYYCGTATSYCYYLSTTGSLPVTASYNDLYGATNVARIATAEHNLASWQAQTGNPDVTGTVTSDPLLAPDGMHIQSGSPCREAGTNIPTVTTDIDGEARPYPGGGVEDIGCDEYTVAQPGTFNLLAPRNDSMNVPVTNIDFDWQDATGVEMKYDLWLGTSNANPPGSAIATDLTSSTYNYTGTLSYDQDYYWRVRAWNPAGERWSGTENFHFKTGSGAAPPVITGLTRDIEYPFSYENVKFQATITCPLGTVDSTELRYSYNRTVWNMVPRDSTVGDVYHYHLPPQTGGDSVHYKVWASSVLDAESESPVSSYLVPPDVSLNNIQYVDTTSQPNRSPYFGKRVHASGVVSGVLTDKKFYIGQAPGGAWRGLMVYASAGATVAVGESLDINGVMAEYSGLDEILPSRIVVGGTGCHVDTAVVTIVQARQEAFEGVRVRLDTVMVAESTGVFNSKKTYKLVDYEALDDPDTITVYVDEFSAFVGTAIPPGYFSLVSNVGDYNRRQLLPDDPDNIIEIVPAPGAFALSYPATGAPNVPVTGELHWHHSSDAGLYDVYMKKAGIPGPGDLVGTVSEPDTFYAYTGLDYTSIYGWKVVARNLSGAEECEEVFYFTTAMQAPAAFELLLPADGAVELPLAGDLVWEPSDRTEEYDVFLKEGSEPGPGHRIATTEHPTTTCPYTLNVSSGKTYYWNVRARNRGGATQSTSTFHFSTAAGLPSWPEGWHETEAMPRTPTDKPVKDGGWLAAGPNPGSGVRGQGSGSGPGSPFPDPRSLTSVFYVAKGNKTTDFFRYYPLQDSWVERRPIPVLEGTKTKPPSKGCVGVSDGRRYLYVTKGNNTLGFWRYDVVGDSWHALSEVPIGGQNKKVKGGTDMVYVPVRGDTGWVYLLKGYKTEFYRYNTATGIWDLTLAPVPAGGGKEKYDKGSFLVYDGTRYIYAHQAKYYDKTALEPHHYMFRYDLQTGRWSTPLKGMPLAGWHSGKPGKNKKSKDGGAGDWYAGNAYVLKGGNTQQFFRYFPEQDSWEELDTVPGNGSTGKKKYVKQGGDLAGYGGGVFFCLKGNKTLELWRYMPSTLNAPRRTPDNAGAQAQTQAQAANLRVLPNPIATGVVTVRIQGFKESRIQAASVRVFDAAGRCVLARSFDTRHSSLAIPLDIRRLPSGVYLVRLDAGGLSATDKLVVQR